MKDLRRRGFWDYSRLGSICFPTYTTTALTESVWCKYFRTWSLLKAYNFQGKTQTLSLNKFRSISALQQLFIPYTQPRSRKLHRGFWGILHTACSSQNRQKAYQPPNIKDLSSDHRLLLLITGMQTKCAKQNLNMSTRKRKKGLSLKMQIGNELLNKPQKA